MGEKDGGEVAFSLVGTARCAVRAAFSGATKVADYIQYLFRLASSGDSAARRSRFTPTKIRLEAVI